MNALTSNKVIKPIEKYSPRWMGNQGVYGKISKCSYNVPLEISEEEIKEVLKCPTV